MLTVWLFFIWIIWKEDSETPPGLVFDAISRLSLNREDVLLDIGSGIGNVLLQVSAQVGCRVYGIEIDSELHKIAAQLKDHYITLMKEKNKPFGDIQLLLVCQTVTN